MKLTKTGTFLLVLLIMAAIAFVGMWWPERGVNVIGIMSAFGTFGTFFIGLQVANNGVKGKNWNQDMYNSENPEGKAEKKEGSNVRNDKANL